MDTGTLEYSSIIVPPPTSTVPTHSEILGAQAETSQTFYINSVGDKQFESTEVLGTTAGSKEASEQSRPCTEAPTTTSSTHDALSGRVESDAELHVTPAMSRSPTSGRSAGESGSGAYATYATSDAFFSGSGVDSGVVTTTPSGSQVPKVKVRIHPSLPLSLPSFLPLNSLALQTLYPKSKGKQFYCL